MKFGNDGGDGRFENGPVVTSDEPTDKLTPKGLGATGKGGTDELSADEAMRRQKAVAGHTFQKPTARQEAKLQAVRDEGAIARENDRPARISPSVEERDETKRTIDAMQAHQFADRTLEAEQANDTHAFPQSFTQADIEAVMIARHNIQNGGQSPVDAQASAEQTQSAAQSLSMDQFKAIQSGQTVTDGPWQYQQNAENPAKIDVSIKGVALAESVQINAADLKTGIMQKEAKAAVNERFAAQPQAPAKSALQERGDKMAIARGDQPTIVERLRLQGQGASLTDKQGNTYSLKGDELVKTTRDGKVGKINADAAHNQQKAAMKAAPAQTAKPTAGKSMSALQVRAMTRAANSAKAAEIAAQRDTETEKQAQTR